MKTGTNNKPATPKKKIKFLSNAVVGSESALFPSSTGRTISPFIVKESAVNGTIMATILGTIKVLIIVIVVNCPPIHNIVVVTSPIGDQAPPALAATTTIPAKNQRSYLSSINFLSKETITIVVVKLSKAAEKKKVSTLTIHNNFTLFFVVILSVIIEKPS